MSAIWSGGEPKKGMIGRIVNALQTNRARTVLEQVMSNVLGWLAGCNSCALFIFYGKGRFWLTRATFSSLILPDSKRTAITM